VADDEDDARRPEPGERRERIADERPPGELVQDLGPPGPHPGAEAGGEHDRAENGGVRHGRGRYHNVLGIAPREPGISLQPGV